MSNSSILRKLFPKSLSQEVIEVFAASPAIKKLGHNDEDDFDYLMILTVCQEFKGKLFERGIVFTATDINCAFEQISEGQQFAYRCTVRTKFEAKRKCWFGEQRFDLGEALGAGRDFSEMIALATAQTFAYKAMLKRSSMTYGENEDAEASQRSDDHQQRTWDAAVRDSGMTVPEISALLSKKFCQEVHAENIPKLTNKAEFDAAVKWLRDQRDLTPAWSDAVVDITTRKGARHLPDGSWELVEAQPIVAALDRRAKDEAAY